MQQAALPYLPVEVLSQVLEKLVTLDALSNVQTIARDIAAVACTSRVYKQLARTKLWPALGAKFKPCCPDDLIACLKREDYFELSLASKTRRLENVPSFKEVAKAYQAAPGHVPSYIFQERARLKGLGLVASSAEREFLLTKAELADLPSFERSRGPQATSYVYSLGDLLAAARKKHGDAHMLRMAKEAKANEAARRKRAAEEASDKKRQELIDHLEAHGLEWSNLLLDIAGVGRYVRVKTSKLTDDVLQLVELGSFSIRNAGYSEVRSQVLDVRWKWACEVAERGIYSGLMELSSREELDLVCYVVQRWARRHGGKGGALSRSEVPASLKGRLSAALDHKLGSDMRDWVDELAVEDEPPVATAAGCGGAQQQPEGQEEQEQEQQQLDGQQQLDVEPKWEMETQAVEAYSEHWRHVLDKAVEEELELEAGRLNCTLM